MVVENSDNYPQLANLIHRMEQSFLFTTTEMIKPKIPREKRKRNALSVKRLERLNISERFLQTVGGTTTKTHII